MYKCKMFGSASEVEEFLNKNVNYDVVSMAINGYFIYLILKEKE